MSRRGILLVDVLGWSRAIWPIEVAFFSALAGVCIDE